MLGPNLKGALLALIAMGLYATHDVFIKVLGQTYPAMQILFFASVFSFPLVAVMLMHDRTPGTLRPNRPGWVALRSLCIVGSGIGGFYAFSILPLTQVYAILFASPLLVTIMSIPVLQEKVGMHRWVAVILGLCGVLVVLQPGQGNSLSLGHAAALLGAFCSALGSVIVRKLGATERPIVLLLWPMLGNFVLTGSALSLAYRPMELSHLLLAGVIALLGFVAGFLVILAYRAGEAAIVAPMQYSQILWGTAYGWQLSGESPDRATLIGASIIIASGVYIVWREGRGGNSANTPVLAGRMRPETVTSPKSSLIQRLWPARPSA